MKDNDQVLSLNYELSQKEFKAICRDWNPVGTQVPSHIRISIRAPLKK